MTITAPTTRQTTTWQMPATGIPMRTRVKLKEWPDEERARRMLGSAERYCSTVQTLRNGVNVTTDFAIANS
jgi:uncharacterized OsmC-like protein